MQPFLVAFLVLCAYGFQNASFYVKVRFSDASFRIWGKIGFADYRKYCHVLAPYGWAISKLTQQMSATHVTPSNRPTTDCHNAQNTARQQCMRDSETELFIFTKKHNYYGFWYQTSNNCVFNVLQRQHMGITRPPHADVIPPTRRHGDTCLPAR